MSNPNPNVWGEPSAWINAEIFPAVGSGNSTIKAVKPKCTQFQAASPWYSRMSLGRGVQMGKITANQSIDNSICTNGQHPIISPFAHIGLFKNKQSSSSNIIPDSVYNETNQINWFFADVNAGSGGLRDHTINTTQANERWSPNADSSDNMNYWTSPLVYYQIKSILLLIKVDVITGYDSHGFPTMQTYSLREWKTSHSDKKVAQIWLQFYGYSQLAGNNLSYSTSDITSQPDQCTTVCIMNSVNNIIDYATYNVDRRCKFYILHALQDNGYDTTTTYYSTAYNMFENQTYHSNYYQSTEGGWNLWCEIPYSDANYETILKMAALFGCPFTDTSTTTFDINFLSDDLFLPVIPENGIALGEYTHGVRNVLNSLYDADSVRDLNYDPDTPINPVDPNTYSDTTDFNSVNFISAFTKRYLLNATQVGQLAGELWDAMATKDPDELTSDFTYDEFLTNNPIDTIVSLKYFPCTFTDAAPAVVHLGKYQTGIAATALGTSVRVIDFDPINVYRHFHDFRDFDPYTQLQLYIPFCGVIKIPTAECMGKYVGVKLAIDTATGAATAFVIVSENGSGGICVASTTGNAAIDIPVSGLQSANIQNAIFNANATYMQTALSTGSYMTGLYNSKPSRLGMLSKAAGDSVSFGGIARGIQSPLGAFSAAVSLVDTLNPVNMQQKTAQSTIENQKAIYDLQHIEMPTRVIGSASPTLGTVIELQCRLIIYRPITDETALSKYAETVGYSCLMSGTVSDFSGLTVGTIDVSGINASDSEKAAISAAFANGVYL